MPSYFPGVLFRNGRRPGYETENDDFQLQFLGVDVRSESEDLKRSLEIILETSYDWKLVMDRILEVAAESHTGMDDMVDDVEDALKNWLKERQGWGLTFAILPFQLQHVFLLIVRKLVDDLEPGVSDEDIFENMKSLYENNRNRNRVEFPTLPPKLAIHLSGKGSPGERMKYMTLVMINSLKFKLLIKFQITKKRKVDTLVERAAEVVGEIVEDPDCLEVPKHLKEAVTSKIADADWVAEYWIEKNREIERKRKSEGDESGPSKESRDGVETGSEFMGFISISTERMWSLFRGLLE